MWQTPNQRTQAAQNSRKLQQERLSRPIHIKRVRAEVRLAPFSDVHGKTVTETAQGAILEARMMLNDLSPTGIGIYASEPMPPGVSVKISLQEPQALEIEGKVVWCQNDQTSSRVLSKESYPYRVGIQFTFTNPDDEAALRAFCENLRSNYLYTPKHF